MKHVLASLVIALLAWAPVADAQSPWQSTFDQRSDSDRRDSQNQQARLKSPGEILQMLRARYGGYHRNIDRMESSGRTVYIVDWVSGRGEFMTFRVDAETGRIIG